MGSRRLRDELRFAWRRLSASDLLELWPGEPRELPLLTGSGLQVRIGVNTGETIVNLAARPEAGEGMVAGDVVNTAARLQSAAPVDGILVGSQTYEATKHVVDFGEATPVTAKGKSEPVPAWPVQGARSTLGVDVAQPQRTTLVGRDPAPRKEAPDALR